MPVNKELQSQLDDAHEALLASDNLIILANDNLASLAEEKAKLVIALAELSASNDDRKVLLDMSPNAVVVVDASHKIASANLAFGHIFEIDASTLVGLTELEFDSFIQEKCINADEYVATSGLPISNDLKPQQSVLSAMNNKLDFQINLNGIKNISRRYVDCSITRISRIIHFQDISKSKDYEKKLLSSSAQLLISNKALNTQNDELNLSNTALQESEKRLSLITTSKDIGVWDWNLQTNIMFWDDVMFSLYYSKPIKLMKNDYAVDIWEKALHPDDLKPAQEAINAALNNIEPFNTTFRIIRPGGEIRHIKALGTVYRDDNGIPIRMLGTNIDISDAFLIDKMKSEFVATAAHELRTPLTVIHGYTELLQMGIGDMEAQQEMLGAIHQQSQAMIHLLNDLLDVAKIEAQIAGNLEMELQQIGPCLQALATTFITPDNHDKVTLDLSPNLPEVKVDITKLEQAIKNCLSNAYKYSPALGEVTMRATEVMHDKQRKVVIAIEDHGIGMTPEQLGRVFEKFYRADQSGAIPGTGLGMAISEDIMEKLGGSIEITSEYGNGTKVMLYLPVA